MRHLIQNLRSGLNRLRETLFKRLFRARFRYDIFISYSHSDAKAYAVNLKKQLSSLDFACFIDEEESPPGLSLGPTLGKALKKSAVLVLLATERALTRPYIALEFESFIPTERTIIPINISGALTDNDEPALSKAPWNLITERNLIWIDETNEAFAKQNPSPPIADGIDKLFKYTRRNVRVRAEIIGTATLVLLAAFGAGFIIKGQATEVSKQAGLAEVARKETSKQQAIAIEAGNDAQRQLKTANQAREEAQRQLQIADTAMKEAERQQEIARTATAEAEKQQRLAREATLEAQRQQEIAKAEGERNRRMRYVSDVNFAQRAHEYHEMERVYQILSAQIPPPGTAKQDDLRTFYWYYLWSNSYRELARLKGHKDKVFSVAFSPDSKKLASAGEDGSVKLWDTNTWQELATLKAKHSIFWVTFSPDGKTLASGGTDGIVRLWDIGTGNELATLKGHKHIVGSVAFSPDGKMLASASVDQTVKLWDTSTRQELRTLQGHQGPVYSVAFSSDGKFLGSGSADGTIKVWDTTTWRELVTTLKDNSGPIRSIAFKPGWKDFFVSAGDDGTVKMWIVGNKNPSKTIQAHSRVIYSVVYSPDGQTIASGGVDGVVRLFDIDSGEELAILRQSETVYSVAFSPDGKMLSSAARIDSTLRVSDTRLGLSALHTGGGCSLTSAAFSPDNKIFASGCNKSIMLWDVDSGEKLATLTGHSEQVNAVAYSPGGNIVASASDDGTVKLWDTVTMRESATLVDQSAKIGSITFSPDGHLLASAGNDHTIRLWDIVARRNVATLRGHSKPVNSFAFSKDSRTLASASSEGTVKLWDLRTRRELTTLKGRESQGDLIAVISVAFSQDGMTLLSVNGDGTLKIWRTRTWDDLPTSTVRSTNIDSAAFSPDGTTLASSKGSTLKLWDVSTGQELATFLYRDQVNTSLFSPDGRTLATVFSGGVSLRRAISKEEVEAALRKHSEVP